MNRFLPLILSGLIGLSLVGCNSAPVFIPSDTTMLTPKPDGYDIPVQREDVARPHRVLGELRVTREITANFGESNVYDLAVGEMKAQARRVGGDAVVNLKTLDGQAGGSQGRLTLVGTVVVFSSPAPATTAGR